MRWWLARIVLWVVVLALSAGAMWAVLDTLMPSTTEPVMPGTPVPVPTAVECCAEKPY